MKSKKTIQALLLFCIPFLLQASQYNDGGNYQTHSGRKDVNTSSFLQSIPSLSKKELGALKLLKLIPPLESGLFVKIKVPFYISDCFRKFNMDTSSPTIYCPPELIPLFEKYTYRNRLVIRGSLNLKIKKINKFLSTYKFPEEVKEKYETALSIIGVYNAFENLFKLYRMLNEIIRKINLEKLMLAKNPYLFEFIIKKILKRDDERLSSSISLPGDPLHFAIVRFNIKESKERKKKYRFKEMKYLLENCKDGTMRNTIKGDFLHRSEMPRPLCTCWKCMLVSCDYEEEDIYADSSTVGPIERISLWNFRKTRKGGINTRSLLSKSFPHLSNEELSVLEPLKLILPFESGLFITTKKFAICLRYYFRKAEVNTPRLVSDFPSDLIVLTAKYSYRYRGNPIKLLESKIAPINLFLRTNAYQYQEDDGGVLSYTLNKVGHDHNFEELSKFYSMLNHMILKMNLENIVFARSQPLFEIIIKKIVQGSHRFSGLISLERCLLIAEVRKFNMMEAKNRENKRKLKEIQDLRKKYDNGIIEKTVEGDFCANCVQWGCLFRGKDTDCCDSSDLMKTKNRDSASWSFNPNTIPLSPETSLDEDEITYYRNVPKTIDYVSSKSYEACICEGENIYL